MEAPKNLLTLAWHVTSSQILDKTEALRNAEDDDTHQESTVHALVHDAHVKNYDYVCLPLTNDNWRQRWREMCLKMPGTDEAVQLEIQDRAEKWRARGGLDRSEVTVTRLGERSAMLLAVSRRLGINMISCS
jgi:hypothetical protein